MKNIFNTFCYILSLLTIIACSDDNVNDFSPVPYPDEVVNPNPEPNPDPDSEPI
jgi:sialidase-1